MAASVKGQLEGLGTYDRRAVEMLARAEEEVQHLRVQVEMESGFKRGGGGRIGVEGRVGGSAGKEGGREGVYSILCSAVGQGAIVFIFASLLLYIAR